MNITNNKAAFRPSKRMFTNAVAVFDFRTVLALPLVFWVFSLFMYRFGLISNPPLGVITYLYIFVVAVAIYLGVYLGYSKSAHDTEVRNDKRKGVLFERYWIAIALIGAVSATIWAYDLKKGGYDIQNTLEDTAMVRHKHLGVTSWKTTISSPFVCASFCGLSYIIYALLYKRRNVSAILFFATLFTLAGFTYITMLQVSRQGILQFIIIALLTFLSAGMAMAVRSIRSLSMPRTILLLLGISACLGYFVFITVNRQDQYQYEAGIASLSLRLDIDNALPKPVEATIIGANYYFSHAWGNLDRCLNSGKYPVLHFDTYWLGYLNQAMGRLGLDFEPNYLRMDAMKGAAGINEVEWPTGLFYFIFDFGIIGALIPLFALGLALGHSAGSLRHTVDFGNLYFCVMVISFLAQLALYYPVNQIYWIPMYIAIILKGISLIKNLKFE